MTTQTDRSTRHWQQNWLLPTAMLLFVFGGIIFLMGDVGIAILGLAASTWPIFLVIGLLYLIVGRDPTRVD